jgi:hypothetical protein
MHIEERFISLELAKKLNDLGFNSESIFVWEWFSDQCYGLKYSPYAVVPYEYDRTTKIYKAYNSSELMDLLPHRITLKENEPFNSFTLYIKKSFIVKGVLDREKYPEQVSLEEVSYQYIYGVNYECDSTECGGENAWLKRYLFKHNIWDENFSNALAKTLIYLRENKLI